MATSSHEQLHRLMTAVERAQRAQRLGVATAKECADYWLTVEHELSSARSVLGREDAEEHTRKLLQKA